MGNCLFGGVGEVEQVIQVVTSTGGIMEFYSPITVESITDEFPGHGVFRGHDLFWKPLPYQEVLLGGESYYLLPLSESGIGGHRAQMVGHVRSNSVPASLLAPYRMSFDSQIQSQSQGMRKRSYTEVLSGCNPRGFWKVKLVISPQHLLEILSQEDRTQELIESVRTVAKCGNVSALSPLAFSDQWSLSNSSTRNINAPLPSSTKDALLDVI